VTSKKITFPSPIVRNLGLQEYNNSFQAMCDFTQNRGAETADELWIVEHPPVYTLGLNGKREHLLKPTSIPVITTDRGGQVTYHGPGQLVIYTLIDLNRHHFGVRSLVTLLETAMIDTLKPYGLSAYAKTNAPGAYIKQKKIGSVGLRIRKGCSYHGLSLNNNMDLTPFQAINPCGFKNLEMTQLIDHNISINNDELAIPLVHAIYQQLS